MPTFDDILVLGQIPLICNELLIFVFIFSRNSSSNGRNFKEPVVHTKTNSFPIHVLLFPLIFTLRKIQKIKRDEDKHFFTVRYFSLSIENYFRAPSLQKPTLLNGIGTQHLRFICTCYIFYWFDMFCNVHLGTPFSFILRRACKKYTITSFIQPSVTCKTG